jgi:hypothetical protein
VNRFFSLVACGAFGGIGSSDLVQVLVEPYVACAELYENRGVFSGSAFAVFWNRGDGMLGSISCNLWYLGDFESAVPVSLLSFLLKL